jgi:hypothetical protein
MGVKDDFVQRGTFVVGYDMRNRFWLGETSLASQYPNIFYILRTKEVTIAYVLSQMPLNIKFNRMLTRDK